MSEATTAGYFSGELNFLLLPGAGDFPGPRPSTDAVLAWLCGDSPTALQDILRRYGELKPNVFIAPMEPRIRAKLVYPLRSAKGSYMLGNYLGTIALCGMVAEMVALLLWELCEVKLSGLPLNNEQEQKLFGSTFEKLGQERRVRVLDGWGMLTEKAKLDFDLVRNARRGHLHLWSKDSETLPTDARDCFDAAVRLFMFGLGLDFDAKKKLVMRPQLLKYLEERGIYRRSVDTSPRSTAADDEQTSAT